MQNSVITSIFRRFAYLSADVHAPSAKDHPQLVYQDFNHFDPVDAEIFSSELNAQAQSWADVEHPLVDPEFRKAIDGLKSMLDAISATSFMMIHCNELFIERPGMEVEKRRKEITDLCENLIENWKTSALEEKQSFARLALLGIAPLQLELVNYLDTAQVPNVLGRMLSRIDQIGKNRICSEKGAIASLKEFFDLENAALDTADLVRIGMPMGTRPRVYVPKEVLSIDPEVYQQASNALRGGINFEDSIVNLFKLVWRDFADEGFMVLHNNNNVDAYALIGGCCYHYGAVIDQDSMPKTVTQAEALRFIATAGEYTSRPWRRKISDLCFENATEALIDFRRGVIEHEALPPTERASAGESGYLKKAAGRLLNRQVNYNVSHVLNGRMERISSVEWSPNMCRDQFGAIYNPPHALGGVGEMFRTLIDYGGKSSQFRTWREMDGTHNIADVQKFLGYSKALDNFLISPSMKVQPGNMPQPI